MSPVWRVVFDTSTLVGAALKPGSVQHRAFLQALARCDACASAHTWLELEQVMQRDRFDLYLRREARLDFVALLRQSMRFFPVTQADEDALQPHCRDRKDDKFLALAQVCHADAVVSSNRDLLMLDPWRGIPVLTPAAFLSLNNAVTRKEA